MLNNLINGEHKAKHVTVIGRSNMMIDDSPDLDDPIDDGVCQLEKGTIVKAEGKTLTLNTGVKIEADTIIYCTGFEKKFPFIDE